MKTFNKKAIEAKETLIGILIMIVVVILVLSFFGLDPVGIKGFIKGFLSPSKVTGENEAAKSIKELEEGGIYCCNVNKNMDIGERVCGNYLVKGELKAEEISLPDGCILEFNKEVGFGSSKTVCTKMTISKIKKDQSTLLLMLYKDEMKKCPLI